MIKKSKPKHDYGAKDIEMLEGLEPVRENPSFYLGNVKTRMLQCFREIVDNSVDEWKAGFGETIFIELDTKTNTMTVGDSGRGIPVDFHAKAKMSAMTLVLGKLNAGGKFGTSNQYKSSGGLHGVGVSCVNGVAEKFEAWSHNDGKNWFYQAFKKGKPVQKDPVKKQRPPMKVTGTAIRFTPDESMFKGHHAMPVDEIRDWIMDAQYLCPGLKFVLTVDGKTETYRNSKGLKQYVLDIISDEELSRMGQVFHFTSKDNAVDIAFSWTSAEAESVLAYVNNIYTPEKGTHYDGFKKAFNDAIKPFKPKDKTIRWDDLRIGLVGVLHLRLYRPLRPSFDGQTKEKLDTDEATQIVYDALYPELKRWFQQNNSLVARIYMVAAKMKKLHEKFRKENAAVRALHKFEPSSGRFMVKPPNRFLSAFKVKPEDREIFIVEGGSAKGTLKNARNDWQEILALSGKFPNAIRATPTQMTKNDNVANMITVIGAGVRSKCKIEKCRGAKIIIMMDADPDGQHLNALSTAFLCTYMRPIVDGGMVYIIDAPLFKAEYKGDKLYGKTKSDLRKKLPRGAKGVEIQRFKGWGEASGDDLETIAMDIKQRKMFRLVIKDGDMERLKLIMGDDTTMRKELLGLLDTMKEVA